MKRTCILIGEDNLLIECGILLLQKNYTIRSVISVHESTKQWCRKEKICCLSTLEEYLHIKQEPVDYLFSIVNSKILTSEHLACATKAAFNYHDSILPSYAGLNATVWSIINGEETHGITWHVIDTDIDTGDIVYQKQFSTLNENVLSLNLRCFEEAVVGLNKILDDIESNCLQRYKQHSIARSYYGKGHVLPDLGFINWHVPGELIYRIFRALAHGHYDNRVGTLKLALGKNYLVVIGLELSDFKTTNISPGEIIAISRDGIQIATTSFAVIIKKWLLPNGVEIDIENCIKKYNWGIGFQFHSYPPLLLQKLASRYSQALIKEPFWIKQFKNIDDHQVFSERAFGEQSFMNELCTISLASYEFNLKKYSLLKYGVAAILIYLYRINDYEQSSCFLLPALLPETSIISKQLFSNYRPIVSQFKPTDLLSEVLDNVSRQIEVVINQSDYLSDLFTRHPALEDVSVEPIISIGWNGIEKPIESIMHFELDEKALEIKVFHNINCDYQDGELKPLLLNLQRHVEKIINFILKNDQICLNKFDLVSDEERQKLYSWGTGPIKTLSSDCIYSLFQEHVRLRPHAPAIYTDGKVITYDELCKQAEQIATYIKSLSIAPQTPFAIYMNRSKEMLYAVLGILCAGCVYVPLDKKYPMNKIDLIIKGAEVKCIFSTEDSAQLITEHYIDNNEIQVIVISDIPLVNDNNVLLPENNNYSNQNTAYIMYTSGTTGVPKGVVISHQNVINYCYWFTQSTSFKDDSIIDFSSSLAFDLSIPCTIAPLIFGGALSICTENQKVNPELYLDYLNDNKITHIELTPGYLELLLHYPQAIQNLKFLRFLLLGADTVHTEEVKKWMRLCPQCFVVNEYGPTEATVSVTSYFVESISFLNGSVVPIGNPAFNSTSYLLDKHMNLCPIGMKGELYIGGKQVAQGYLNSPELTAEKFIPVSFNGQDVLYKTGDLSCWLPGGVLQFFGRNDHQVKIHGYRVELPAIETLLMQHDKIGQAVVVIRNAHHVYLRVYLVLENKSLSFSEIKNFLAKHMPFYMHPKEFCIVDSIPLKENEKINFDLLETQYDLLSGKDTRSIDDELSVSEQLCLGCWQDSFHQDLIKLDDNFFSLGGDSLIALHIITQLKNKAHQDLHLSALFKYPTIRELAAYLDELKNDIKCETDVRRNCLIRLSVGPNPKLFLVHPVGGTVFWYQHIANKMNDVMTVYGIEDPSINNKDFYFSSFDEMANYYVEIILNEVHEDIVYLGGASFGANLAFEMASKLQKSGKKIGFLGLFDGWTNYPSSLMEQTTIDLLTQNKPELLSDNSKHLNTLEEHRRKLLLDHQVEPLAIDACLFKAQELWPQFATCDLKDNGWKTYVNGTLQTYLVPGNHETMLFSSNAESLATLLQTILIQQEQSLPLQKTS